MWTLGIYVLERVEQVLEILQFAYFIYNKVLLHSNIIWIISSRNWCNSGEWGLKASRMEKIELMTKSVYGR